MKALATRLREKGFAGGILEKEPLARHCSLRVGGEADLMAVPEDLEDLRLVTVLLAEEGEPWMVLGGARTSFSQTAVLRGASSGWARGFHRSARREMRGFLPGHRLSFPHWWLSPGKGGWRGSNAFRGFRGPSEGE